MPLRALQEELGYGRLSVNVKEAKDLIAADVKLTGESEACV